MESLYLIALATANGAQALYILACRRSLAAYRWSLALHRQQPATRPPTPPTTNP